MLQLRPRTVPADTFSQNPLGVTPAQLATISESACNTKGVIKLDLAIADSTLSSRRELLYEEAIEMKYVYPKLSVRLGMDKPSSTALPGH